MTELCVMVSEYCSTYVVFEHETETLSHEVGAAPSIPTLFANDEACLRSSWNNFSFEMFVLKNERGEAGDVTNQQISYQ